MIILKNIKFYTGNIIVSLSFITGVFINISAFAADIFPAMTQTSLNEKMVIYSSLDVNFVGDIILEYQRLHQNVEVEYHDLQTFSIYEKIITESDENKKTADFVFSSAMDLQVKLANDGYAQAVNNAVLSDLPHYAQWRKMVFGLTNEPAVIIYNKEWFKDKKLPTTHEEFSQFLNQYSSEIYNKVATYNIERSGLGLFFIAQDKEFNRNIWSLVNRMGEAGVTLYSSSSAILQRVASGRFVIGYNILGSYAKTYAKAHPNLGIITPNDYTIIMSRIGLVPKYALKPRLGKSFLGFLASKQGQDLLKKQINMLSLSETRESSKYHHVRIGPGLVVYQDQLKRRKLISKWNKALNKN